MSTEYKYVGTIISTKKRNIFSKNQDHLAEKGRNAINLAISYALKSYGGYLGVYIVILIYCSNIYLNIYTVLLLWYCCIKRAYVYLGVKSSCQMTKKESILSIYLSKQSFQ